jgi:hypothetical protein
MPILKKPAFTKNLIISRRNIFFQTVKKIKSDILLGILEYFHNWYISIISDFKGFFLIFVFFQ